MRNREKNPNSSLLLLLLAGAVVGYFVYSKVVLPKTSDASESLESLKQAYKERSDSLQAMMSARLADHTLQASESSSPEIAAINNRLADVYRGGATDLAKKAEALRAIRADIPTKGSRLYITTSASISAIQDFLDFSEEIARKTSKLLD
jgi:hypothetical protein